VRESRPSNRLINETSPYLEQLANNPVDWHPWGKEAIELAQRQNRPILLSVGYSACHWCQVMDRGCFHDEEIARLLNSRYICVKVDREERPDIDQVYQAALEILRPGSGGWPLNVWLTPELEPYYAGNYFPPSDRKDQPGFARVLETMADQFTDNRDKVEAKAAGVSQRVRDVQSFGCAGELVGYEVIDDYMDKVVRGHDQSHGGFGGAPKFPPPQHLSIALRSYRRTRDEALLKVVVHTLDCMARGGIHDQLGGGFHRYATDVRWLVPRFEKMLYDNALLTRVYTEAYLVTGEDRFRRVACSCIDFVLRDMVNEARGFCSTIHAEVDGVEGVHYLWAHDEVQGILGERDGSIFADCYGVTEAGNFKDGKSVLHVARSCHDAALQAGLSRSELDEVLSAGRAKLFEVRTRRTPPARDDKIIVAWNGLMIGALARGGRVFDRSDYLAAAISAAELIRGQLYKNAKLSRVYRAGVARLEGFLEDYSFLANGLVDLYEATFDPSWLAWAHALVTTIHERFADSATGGLFFTTYDHERLVARTRERQDAAMPSGASQALMASLRVGRLTGDERLYQLGIGVIRSYETRIRERPTAFATMLAALDFHLAEPTEIAVVGHRKNPDAEILRRLVNGSYLPNAVIAGSWHNGSRPRGAATPQQAIAIPILEGKKAIRGRPTVYICRNHTCSPPITDPERLIEVLRA